MVTELPGEGKITSKACAKLTPKLLDQLQNVCSYFCCSFVIYSLFFHQTRQPSTPPETVIDTLSILSILASRFLMNLQHAADASAFAVNTESPSYVGDEQCSSTAMSSIQFASRRENLRAENLCSGSTGSDEDIEFLPGEAEC